MQSNITNTNKMEAIVLKAGILDKIKSNPQLFADIATALKVSIYTLPKLLKENDPRLTQANVLRILREHLGDLQDSELLEGIVVPENANA